MNQVQIIQAHYLDVYKWLRANTYMELKECRDYSKNGSIIDFGEDVVKCVEFYCFLTGLTVTSAKIEINQGFDSRGSVGAYAYTEEQINSDEIARKEFNSIN